MNYHSKRLCALFAGVLFVVISQMTVFGADYFSFGKGVNQSFGPEDAKDRWVSASIFVPVSGTIQNLDITLNLQHTSFCDLEIYIDSPSGTSAWINYYDKDNFKPARNCDGWITFDQECLFDIDKVSLSLGIFKPNGPDSLDMFYGQKSSGIWKVRIQDIRFYDTGILKDARLDMLIDPEPLNPLFVPEPTTLLLAAAGAAFLLRFKRNT